MSCDVLGHKLPSCVFRHPNPSLNRRQVVRPEMNTIYLKRCPFTAFLSQSVHKKRQFQARRLQLLYFVRQPCKDNTAWVAASGAAVTCKRISTAAETDLWILRISHHQNRLAKVANVKHIQKEGTLLGIIRTSFYGLHTAIKLSSMHLYIRTWPTLLPRKS